MDNDLVAKLVMKAYRKGMADGLRAFAFWRNGQQFCGDSSMMPLDQAIEKMDTLSTWDPPVIKAGSKDSADG